MRARSFTGFLHPFNRFGLLAVLAGASIAFLASLATLILNQTGQPLGIIPAAERSWLPGVICGGSLVVMMVTYASSLTYGVNYQLLSFEHVLDQLEEVVKAGFVASLSGLFRSVRRIEKLMQIEDWVHTTVPGISQTCTRISASIITLVDEHLHELDQETIDQLEAQTTAALKSEEARQTEIEDVRLRLAALEPEIMRAEALHSENNDRLREVLRLHAEQSKRLHALQSPNVTPLTRQ